MGEHPYHEWFGSPEPCPALYIEVMRPTEKEPFMKDLIAAFDTGAPLTAVPMKYKSTARLHPLRQVKLKWPGYPVEKVPTYFVKITAEGCTPRSVEVVFDPCHDEYALIGRNLMKYWYAVLKGPEEILEISEP